MTTAMYGLPICMDVYMKDQFGLSGYGVPVFLSWFITTFIKIVVVVMTLGLPQVCKLVGGNPGHVKHSASKSPLNHGSQLFLAPTSLNVKVGVTCLP